MFHLIFGFWVFGFMICDGFKGEGLVFLEGEREGYGYLLRWLRGLGGIREFWGMERRVEGGVMKSMKK